MDSTKTGNLIYTLRKQHNMTQLQLAQLLNVSDKTVSKWENGLGMPDISTIKAIADVFKTSTDTILSGVMEENSVKGDNMKNTRFFVCETCGNIITASANAQISCCGKVLSPLEAQKADSEHMLKAENVEDEIYLTADHCMTKQHYIAFTAFLKGDSMLITKHYPQWDFSLRFHKRGVGKLYYYCTQHGLFYINI